jgi:O-antigen biosynthesis protein
VPANVAIAAFFADVADVHRAQRALAALPGIAFGTDDDIAARLAVYTRRSYVELPGPGAWSLAVRFAANATFFRATRDPERLRRVVPTPFATAPCAVLLQLDRVGEGGLERVVADLAAELLAAGHRVGLLALDGGGAPLRGDGLERLLRVSLARRDDAAYEAMLRDGGWQVVDAHTSTFGAAAAARLGVPFVQTVHNSYVWYDRAAIEAMRAADAATAAYACVSAEALGYLDLRLQLDVQKALVLENGIASAAPSLDAAQRLVARRDLGLAADDFVFLQVASLQPAKAHRVAMHALAALRRREPRAKLVCLGSEMNPLFGARVRGDVETLGLRDAVVFAGRRDDAASCHALADAFLLPSYWEGCSLAVWEAVQAGLPMVLSRVGAAAEQLAHGHGELVEPPFASLFALDPTTLPAVTDAVDAAYVERTAAAMQRVMALPRRRDVVLPTVAQRATMAGRKARLFAWLLQGGTVAGCRTMLARAAYPPR